MFTLPDPDVEAERTMLIPKGIGLKAADRCKPMADRYLTMNGPPAEEPSSRGAWVRRGLWLVAIACAALPWFLYR